MVPVGWVSERWVKKCGGMRCAPLYGNQVYIYTARDSLLGVESSFLIFEKWGFNVSDFTVGG